MTHPAAPAFADWFAAHRDEIVAWRHDLHAHPELGFEETRTAGFVAETLRRAGLEVHEGIGRTGLVATLGDGSGSMATLGLRADMDALPIAEKAERPHGSRHAGAMHACGHDGHTTALLAAACCLAEQARANRLAGTVRFIFQPAEENLGGGQAMVDDGLFERFPVDRIFAMHNFPGVEIGSFMTRPGPMMAGFDTFDITVNAVGGHAAGPAQGGDAVVAAAALALQLQTIVSRQVSATDSGVLALTRIEGGSAYNVLPSQVRLAGSVRWFEPAVRDRIRHTMEQMCQGIGTAYGTGIELAYRGVYPALHNTPQEAAFAAQVAREMGTGAVITEFPAVTGSEDFAFMLNAVPGAYIAFGNGPAERDGMLHGDCYDFNDAALESAAGFWVSLTHRFFERADLG